MRKLCDGCAHQVVDGRGGVKCGAARYSVDDGYGAHKQGATCINDADLRDLFEPRAGQEIDVRNMSSRIERTETELAAARDRIRGLERRLLTIDTPPATEGAAPNPGAQHGQEGRDG